MTARDTTHKIAALKAEVLRLQKELAVAKRREVTDSYINVKVTKNQGRFEKVKQENGVEGGVGRFYLEISITTKEASVLVPLSIASGKKVAGFMYHIEGTAAGKLGTAEVRVRGKGVTEVTIGTLRYAKLPEYSAASFEIRATIRGSRNDSYQLVFTRINYKRQLSDARYQQYLKEFSSERVKFI
jgi:hypothetical protein